MVSVTQVVVGFGLSVIASIISAFVTVKLSLKQFRSERLWEKKAETYSNIIEHLSRLEYQLWLWREGMTSHPSLTEEEQERIEDAAKASLDEIMKASSIGAFFITDDAASILLGLRKSIEELVSKPFIPEEDIRSAKGFMGELRTSITRIRECAKADLRSLS